MTHSQLREVMKFHLKNFASNDEGITDQTVHSTILSDNDGFGTANSKRIYRSFIRYTIIQAEHEDKVWPKNWFALTVHALSEKLI